MNVDRGDPRSDDQLIAAANEGDESAFESLYFRYRNWVARLARRLAGNDADALDVLQETFVYFFRKFPGFRRTAALTTFLWPVVRNLSIAARRKRQRFAGDAEALARAHVPADETAGESVDLSAALSSLPEGHREVLLLRFVDGLCLDEIGQVLGIPTGTVKSRLHNALESLRSDPKARRYFLDEPSTR